MVRSVIARVHVRGVDAPVPVDGDLDDLESELLEMAERVSDGVVLHRRGDDPRAARPARPRGPLDGQVVGLGPAAGDHDLAGVRPDRARQALVRRIEGLAGGPPQACADDGFPKAPPRYGSIASRTSGRSGVVAA